GRSPRAGAPGHPRIRAPVPPPGRRCSVREPASGRRGGGIVSAVVWARAHRRCCGDEQGAALVEFAIILTLFFLLIFGMIEFGLDYNDYISVRNGSREGARLAVVNDVSSAPSCRINGSTVSPPANPTNSTDATNALICKTKDRIGLKQSSIKVQIIAGVNPGDS